MNLKKSKLLKNKLNKIKKKKNISYLKAIQLAFLKVIYKKKKKKKLRIKSIKNHQMIKKSKDLIHQINFLNVVQIEELTIKK